MAHCQGTKCGALHCPMDSNVTEMSSVFVGKRKRLTAASYQVKLFRIVSSDRYRSVWWSECGTHFIIDAATFVEEILRNFHVDPQDRFLTRTFSSFVRQLNMYGFRKVDLREKHQPDPCDWCRYAHPCFLQGRADLLRRITRKRARRPQGLHCSSDVARAMNKKREEQRLNMQFMIRGLRPSRPGPKKTINPLSPDASGDPIQMIFGQLPCVQVNSPAQQGCFQAEQENIAMSANGLSLSHETDNNWYITRLYTLAAESGPSTPTSSPREDYVGSVQFPGNVVKETSQSGHVENVYVRGDVPVVSSDRRETFVEETRDQCLTNTNHSLRDFVDEVNGELGASSQDEDEKEELLTDELVQSWEDVIQINGEGMYDLPGSSNWGA